MPKTWAFAIPSVSPAPECLVPRSRARREEPRERSPRPLPRTTDAPSTGASVQPGGRACSRGLPSAERKEWPCRRAAGRAACVLCLGVAAGDRAERVHLAGAGPGVLTRAALTALNLPVVDSDGREVAGRQLAGAGLRIGRLLEVAGELSGRHLPVPADDQRGHACSVRRGH